MTWSINWTTQQLMPFTYSLMQKLSLDKKESHRNCDAFLPVAQVLLGLLQKLYELRWKC